jgi:probable HAF family extracellular repeat protein
MVGLGDLPGGDFFSAGFGDSADGSVIFGQSISASGTEAFRWTAEGGMFGLGDLPGGTFESDPWDISADGSIIVGLGNTALGKEAFLWTAGGGMQNLRELLIAGGAAGLDGWTLTQASAMSADGRTIVGFGRNPAGNTEAWIATITEPSALPGDFNDNGSVDAADYVVWRKGLGMTYTQNDYDTWRAHFANRALAGAGSDATAHLMYASAESLSAAIPEPASCAVVGIALVATLARRRRGQGELA